MSGKDHITICNHAERSNIAGNADPLRRNVISYICKHEDCEIYTHQDLTNAQREKQSQRKQARSNSKSSSNGSKAAAKQAAAAAVAAADVLDNVTGTPSARDCT